MQGVPFDLVQIDLSRKPSWYSGLSSSALVPALAIDDQVLTESIRIARQVSRLSTLLLDAELARGLTCRYAAEELDGPGLRHAGAPGQAQLEGSCDGFASAGLALCGGYVSGLSEADHRAQAQVCACRGWQISGDHSKGASQNFWREVARTMDKALQQHRGPFLLGPDLSLVRLRGCLLL